MFRRGGHIDGGNLCACIRGKKIYPAMPTLPLGKLLMLSQFAVMHHCNSYKYTKKGGGGGACALLDPDPPLDS